jgi:hypothetical protein
MPLKKPGSFSMTNRRPSRVRDKVVYTLETHYTDGEVISMSIKE